MSVAHRRAFLAGAAACCGLVALRPAFAVQAPGDMEKAVADLLAGRKAEQGRVTIDAPPLVENGNSVQLRILVDSPMSAASHVKRIALFNEKNPQPHVALFKLGPRNGRAEVSTRIRLATSQFLTALAEMNDGAVYMDRVEVIVTIAACTEE